MFVSPVGQDKLEKGDGSQDDGHHVENKTHGLRHSRRQVLNIAFAYHLHA